MKRFLYNINIGNIWIKCYLYVYLLERRKLAYTNIINYEVDYRIKTPNTYMIQSLVLYEFSKGLEIGSGANLTLGGGFKPVMALSYSFSNKNIGFSSQVSYELYKDGIIEVFSFFEWHPETSRKMHPFFRIQILSSYKDKHVFSYHFWRLGFRYKTFHFGPALNLKHFGEKTETITNLGIFLRLNI